jgi:hypothetical protein
LDITLADAHALQGSPNELEMRAVNLLERQRVILEWG